MPELITHSVSAYAFRRYLNEDWILFVFGAILPDVVSRPITVIASLLGCESCGYVTLPSHAPLFLLPLSLFIALLFEERMRARVFTYLFLGAMLHNAFDVLQIHLHDRAYPWLFPFSFTGFEIGLFWSDESPYLIPFALMILAMLLWLERRKKMKMADQRQHR
jgi:hypothetical protein